MYGGEGGFWECRYEFMRCTKVDLPAPAIPIVMIAMAFFFSLALALDGAEFMVENNCWDDIILSVRFTVPPATAGLLLEP